MWVQQWTLTRSVMTITHVYCYYGHIFIDTWMIILSKYYQEDDVYTEEISPSN